LRSYWLYIFCRAGMLYTAASASGALYNSLVVSYRPYTFAQEKPKKFYGYGWARGPVGFLKPFSV